jgi:4-amino-4-deoxy-L-arabinose transferase-like glycosyltransferase
LLSPRYRDLLLLVVVSAVLFLPWLGARDLWNPNEPTYGQAVSEMHARGDWLVPTVNGEVFDEKPILYFWLALVAAALTGGVSELSLRLPTAAAGIVATLLLYILVRSWSGRRRAVLAGLFLATTFVVFWSARQVQMDLLLTACTLAAVLGATRALDRPGAGSAGWLLAGTAAGLGFLAKGPVGLLCPGLVVVGYAIATRRGRALVDPALLAGLAAFFVVAAPWYLALWARGETAFLHEVLVRQNLTRFVEPWDHQNPWWYYLKYFWIDMAPWAWFVPLTWGMAATDERERRLERLAWSWIVVIVLFFSLSASKRSPYILPVAPAVAILVAGLSDRWLSRCIGGARIHALRGVHALIGALLLALAVVLATGGAWNDPDDAAVERAAGVLAVVAGLAGLLVLAGAAAAGRRPRAMIAATLVGLAGVYVASSGSLLPAADAFKSHRPFSEVVHAQVGADQPLCGFHVWHWRAGYSFYTGRTIPPIDTLEELRVYWSRPERVFLIVERGRLEEARRVVGPGAPLVERAIGSNRAYLFANRAGYE